MRDFRFGAKKKKKNTKKIRRVSGCVSQNGWYSSNLVCKVLYMRALKYVIGSSRRLVLSYDRLKSAIRQIASSSGVRTRFLFRVSWP